MSGRGDALAALTQIDEARATLVQLLRSADADRISSQAPSGDWSPLENVRHLLFAEQLHFSRLVRLDGRWHPMGLAPHFLASEPPFAAVGRNPTTSLDDVLSAWDAVHEAVRERCSEPSPEVEKALEGNLSHLRHHQSVIESLLKD